MMYLHEGLRDGALKVIGLKSTQEDLKAYEDLSRIQCLLRDFDKSQEYVNVGKNLDRRMGREYPEIQMLCDAANVMIPKRSFGVSVVQKTSAETVKDALKTDYFGILASVLLKHQMITGCKDFIKSVDCL